MRTKKKAEQWEYRVALPTDWTRALECWFVEKLSTDQLHALIYQLENETELAQGLWIACRGLDIDVVAWIIPNTSNSAYCWPIRCRHNLDPSSKIQLATSLWKQIAKYYQSRGVHFFQINVPYSCECDLVLMQMLGFRKIACIQRLQLVIDPTKLKNELLVQLVPVKELPRYLFEQFMIETMQDSLDVPELNAGQSEKDLRTQYQKPGMDRYYIKHKTYGLVGIVVLTSDEDAGVIRYLGLTPAFRHQGLGWAVVQASVHVFWSQGCHIVELRVDARNTPACSVYHRAGFVEVERESLLIYQ